MEKQEKETLIEDFSEEKLFDLTKPQQANKLLTYILETRLRAVDLQSKKSTKEVLYEYKNIKKNNPNIITLSEASIANYLSILSRQSWSQISCPGTKQGYFLAKERNTNATQTSPAKRELEAKLYPYLTEWILAEGYMFAEDISQSRGMYKWGNPDILGINLVEVLGVKNLEVATIEVKKDASAWRTDIFEAVSHSMFANRVYFAYKRKKYEKDDRDMILYAQKFGIGILAIVFPDEQMKEDVGNSNVCIEIIVPAPFKSAEPRLQKQFLDGLKITELASLINRHK